jgi:integrase
VLTDTRIRNAKPREKAYKLPDGLGLHLEVKPTGAKLWRLRYRLGGKENLYAIGRYPETSVADARKARDEARKLIRNGVHPAHYRKVERARQGEELANTFEAISKEWIANNADHWTIRVLLQRKRLLEKSVYPVIGALPVKQVTAAHVLRIIKDIEKQTPTMAVLANQSIGAVCRYAIATLRADMDPTQPLKGSLKPRVVEHHKPLARADIPGFLEALESYAGHFSNKIALHLMLLTLVRTTEMLQGQWTEFDFEAALWRVPKERMKMREAHLIPLSNQAIELLNRLKAVTGKTPYLFPHRSNLHKPASRGVLWKAVASMGYLGKFSPHGIRATGSTILNEIGFRPDVIERQLAHAERNKSRAAYNQAEYLPERRAMLQQWADYLDNLKTGGNVVPIQRAAS